MAKKKSLSQQDVVCITNQLITMLSYYNSQILSNRQDNGKYSEVLDLIKKEIDKYKKRIDV